MSWELVISTISRRAFLTSKLRKIQPSSSASFASLSARQTKQQKDQSNHSHFSLDAPRLKPAFEVVEVDK